MPFGVGAGAVADVNPAAKLKVGQSVGLTRPRGESLGHGDGVSRGVRVPRRVVVVADKSIGLPPFPVVLEDGSRLRVEEAVGQRDDESLRGEQDGPRVLKDEVAEIVGRRDQRDEIRDSEKRDNDE